MVLYAASRLQQLENCARCWREVNDVRSPGVGSAGGDLRRARTGWLNASPSTRMNFRSMSNRNEYSVRYWLMKSEPDEFSIDDLAAAKGRTTAWFGVRNYQARNFMRDQMKVGDRAFFYHSSCPEPGIAGTVEVTGGSVSRRHAVRPQEPVLRCEGLARRAALGERRRHAAGQAAPHFPSGAALASGARADAGPATRQPVVDHSGRSGRVDVRAEDREAQGVK